MFFFFNKIAKSRYSGQYYIIFFCPKPTQIEVILLNCVFKSAFQEISKLRFFINLSKKLQKYKH
jgi:hypothetical protein